MGSSVNFDHHPLVQELLKSFYPRAYQAPAEYPSVKQIALALSRPTISMAIAKTSNNASLFNSVTQDAFSTTVRLLPNSVPTYFVEKNILQALFETDPPDDVPIDAVAWPMEALLFVLPRNTLVSPEDGDCPYLAIARHRANETLSAPILDLGMVKFECDCYTFTTSPIHGFDGSIFATTTNATATPLIRDVVKNELAGNLYGAMNDEGIREETVLSKDDGRFVREMMDLAFRLLLLMSARPDMVSHGSSLPQSEKLKKKGAQEVWTPNFIGKGYKPKQEMPSSTADDHSERFGPRMHWRRGHYRSQPYGPKMGLRKLLWIEPMLIAA